MRKRIAPATSTVQTRWRAVLPVHPAAESFPRMSKAELAALAEDIKANGLRSQVAVIGGPDKPILIDGRNRLDAMERIRAAAASARKRATT
jgi:hypothetical protein